MRSSTNPVGLERLHAEQALGLKGSPTYMPRQMDVCVRATRHLVYEANALLDKTDSRHAYASAVAKCYASNTVTLVATEAVRIAGGNGYSRSCLFERLFLDSKVTQIYEGANGTLRMIIARDLSDGGGHARGPLKGR